MQVQQQQQKLACGHRLVTSVRACSLRLLSFTADLVLVPELLCHSLALHSMYYSQHM